MTRDILFQGWEMRVIVLLEPKIIKNLFDPVFSEIEHHQSYKL